MKRIIKNILMLLIVFTMLNWFSACKTNTKKKTEDNSAVGEEQIDSENIELKNVYFSFPSAHEIFFIISQEELEFKDGLVNPNSNLENYTTSLAQTFNLGIYSADLAYLTLFKKINESVDYYDIIIKLAEKIRIQAAFDESFVNRIKFNVNNIDSMAIISEESTKHIIDYLTCNNKEKTLAIMTTGSLIEIFYTILNSIEDYSDDNPILDGLIDQKYTLENIIEYTAEFKDDKNVAVAYNYLMEIKEIFDDLEKVKVVKTTVKEEDNKLIIGGGTVLAMNKDVFDQLKLKVTNIRNSIVQ